MIYKDKVGFIRFDNRKYENFMGKFFRFIRKICVKVEVENTEKGLIFLIPKYEKYTGFFMKKIQKQIKKQIDKNKISELIVDKCVGIVPKKRTNKILKNSIFKIIEYIFRKNGENTNLENIYVLVNKYNKQNIYVIKKLVEMFKTVNIITQDIKHYQILEKKFFEQGILITISNNKRKGIRNAKYIINIDFDKNEIIEYNIYSESIILNISEQFINIEKGFNGILINDFEIQINEDNEEFINEFYGNIDKKQYLENELKMFQINTEYIDEFYKMYNAKITYLIGVRGRLQDSEFCH